VTTTDPPEADYINASYIRISHVQKNTYIASQGPKERTVNDFWKMIWNENVNRVVMITLLVEMGKKKCERYWPENVNTPSQYGDVTVTLVHTDVFNDYAQRTMNIQYKDEGKRTVTQLQFLLWKDKGVPTEFYPLLTFRRKVRSLDSTSTGPLLVHCSAGVGRTGTFIALDILLDEAKEQGHIDVFGVVQQLRRQRMLMVQVQDQYTFLYYALLETVQFGETAVNKSVFKRTCNSLLSNNPSIVMPRLAKEFELLADYKKSSAVDPDAVGLRSANAHKNRRKSVAPADNVRVHLSSTGLESDYINAALAKGL
jgi:protein tyrosine phosphatase